jgi:hypothetical protein
MKGLGFMITRRFSAAVLAAAVLFLFTATARAQYKLELCEDLKITEAHYGINTVETATCVNPTRTFSPKGTLRNIHMVYSFSQGADRRRRDVHDHEERR